MTKTKALQKAQELWECKWRVYEIHRYLLNCQVKRSVADEIVLKVTGVDFSNDNSYSY